MSAVDRWNDARYQGITGVYRAYDSQDRLLYVGISKDVLDRLGQHRSSGWAQYVTNLTIEYFPTRQQALEAESRAIKDEDPVWNSAGRNADRHMRWMVAYPDRHADDISDQELETLALEALRHFENRRISLEAQLAGLRAAKESHALNLGDI